ncbi:MAG: serine/threonine protein kinase, partial [Bryobacteraceae bacterium]
SVDSDLRREVESLLESYEHTSGALDAPPARLGSLLPPPESLEGERIGEYLIIRALRRSPTGTVYLASRPGAEADVKPLGEGLDTLAHRQQFLNERQVLAGLRHRQVARLLDGGASPSGRPYMVLEHVEGIPIDRYSNERRLSIAQRVELVRQVSNVVEYLHENHVEHRDLAPDNILVTEQGLPKLVEFSSARMARGGVEPGGDVQMLGRLLYLLLCGSPPDMKPVKPSDAVEAIEDPAVRAFLRGRLRGDLDALVMAALEPRYASAWELGEDLRRYQEDLPVSVRADSPIYRAGKSIKRLWRRL